MSYHVVIPAFNEEELLGQCLTSLAKQSLKATEIIVVDDGSTDNTVKVVQRFMLEMPELKLVQKPASGGHEPGGKVVLAFNYGLKQIADYEYVTKLDADIELPANYFEKLIHAFKENPKLGLAGGVAFIQKNEKWIYEKVANEDHVRGPIKTYRRACLESMNGLRIGMGWDTADELLTRFYGWEVKVIKSLRVKHYRETGKIYKSKKAAKNGLVFRNLRYGLVLAMVASLKVAINLKSIPAFLLIIRSYSNKKKPIVTKEEGKFIRKYRWQGILKKLGIFR